jgi:hypothetical protein
MARFNEVLVMLEHKLDLAIRQRAFSDERYDALRHGDLGSFMVLI